MGKDAQKKTSLFCIHNGLLSSSTLSQTISLTYLGQVTANQSIPYDRDASVGMLKLG